MRDVEEISAKQMVIKLALEISSFAESANQNLFTVFCVDKSSLILQEHCSNLGLKTAKCCSVTKIVACL